MKKSAKLRKNDRFNLFIKLISGIILAFMSFLIISNFKKDTNFFDLELILPPNGSILKSIAIPRVSGSSGNEKVRQFIKSQFPLNYWEIEEDVHVMPAPHGRSIKFVNLIITLKNKNIKEDNKNTREDNKRLVLAAHYDSKLLEAEGKETFDYNSNESEFIGASDSAWSCSLIIAIARAIQKESPSRKQNFQLIFFDGEEAVRHWTPTDSLYGSRALAAKWSKLPKESFNSLDKISLMVLLDLIGTKDGNKFYSFYPENSLIDKEFQELILIETELITKNSDFKENTVKSSDFTKNSEFTKNSVTTNTKENYDRYFMSSDQFKSYNGQAIEDDHTPFLPFNVPILHLIPVPFPSVWHTPQDTIEALDREVCERVANIVYKFIRNKLT